MSKAVQRCKEKIFLLGRYDSVPCSRNAKKDGYCGIHHPDARSRRKAKREAIWGARQAKQAESHKRLLEQQRRAECYDDLLAACEAFVRGIEAMNLEDAWQDEMRQARAAIARARP